MTDEFWAIQAFIDETGSPIILRRLTGPQRIRFDVRLNAVVNGFQPEELVGGIIQGDRRVIIGADDIARRQWPGPPRKGDQVILLGEQQVLLTVEGVDVVDIRGRVVRYNLLARGAEG